MHILCDFDGTITTEDCTDVILERFAHPNWEVIEEQWKRGAIGSAECMRRQIALIRADKDTLHEALDAIPIDPFFPDFVDYCRAAGATLTVISDGVDYFIRRILARIGLEHLPVISNHLVTTGNDTYRLEHPFLYEGCTSQAGVCKCRIAKTHSDLRVYIGDGRSDFCVADKADAVFAKGALAVYCAQQDISCIPYGNFADVIQAISGLLQAEALPVSQDLYATVI